MCRPLIAYARLSGALHAAGDIDGAIDAIRKASEIASTFAPGRLSYYAAVKAQLLLAYGDLDAASHWMQESGLGIDDELDLGRMPEYQMLARVLTAQGRPDEAAALLARTQSVAENAGAMHYVIKGALLQAKALYREGKVDRALFFSRVRGRVLGRALCQGGRGSWGDPRAPYRDARG